MDKETIKNLEILEKCGYFYEEESKRFWDSNHELYFNLALAHCNDIVRVINAVVNHEKELAYNDGECSAQRKMRRALGLDSQPCA